MALNRYRTVCRLWAMRIFALDFISENEELSRKRRGAKCARGDTQSCGELFFPVLHRLTGEDLKLVHRQKSPKVNAAPPRYFLLFFSNERRVWLSAESKILASTFGRFRLYRLTDAGLEKKVRHRTVCPLEDIWLRASFYSVPRFPK